MRIWRKRNLVNGNSMVVPQKIKSRITMLSSNPLLGIHMQRTESRVSKRYVYTHVHSCITYKSQKDVEST